MLKIVDLFIKILTKPNEAFKRIKEEKPLRESFIIFFVYAICNLLIFRLIAIKSPEFKDLLTAQTKLLLNPIFNIISTVIWILIFNGILYFFLKRKNQALRFLDILILDFFTFSPVILLFPLQYLLTYFNILSVANLFSFCQLIWSLILLIIGIKVFISSEIKDALIIYIKSALIFVLVILLSFLLTTKLVGTGFYPIR